MKNRISSARLSTVAMAVASLSVSPWVCAQSQLSEVVVTANRMEQVLQTAPIGATVILGDELRASGMSDANEALRKMAGVTARSDQNGGREASIDLRGFGDTASSNMVVLVDGIRISQNELASARLSAISASMIERIEIVRGGSSVVWGDGATAGVIHVITKPSARQGLSGSVLVGVESHGGRDTQLALNVGTEAVRYFLQARSNHSDGMRQNNANTNESVNLGAEVGSDKGLKARLSYFKDNQRSRWPGAITYAQYQVDPTLSTKPLDFGAQTEERTSLLTQYKLDAWLFSLDLARAVRHANGHIDWYSPPPWDGNQDDLRSTKTTQISPRINYSDLWGKTLVSAVAGMDRMNWSFNAQTYYSGFFGGDEQATQKNEAHYFKLDVLFPTQTRVVAGKRHERVEKHDTLNDGFSISSYAQNIPLDAWELGLNQTLGQGWDAFGRAATSYRVANVDENRGNTTPLRPQTAKDQELGLRYSAARSRAGVRLFKQDTVDEIAFIRYPLAVFGSNANMDPVRRRGVELEGQTELNRQWAVSATLQKLSAKFSSGVYAGNTPPHISKLNAAVRTTYTYNAHHQVELAMQKRGSTVLGNDWGNTCSVKNPERTTYDALYRFRSLGDDSKAGAWTVLAGVDNLTNTKSFSWAFTNASCTGPNVYPDVGRVYKVSARYHF